MMIRATTNGYVRLGNKSAGAPGKPKPGEVAVDIDRRNRILGNPFVLHDPNDKAARADVIERFRSKYQAETARWRRRPKSSPSASRTGNASSACAGAGRSHVTEI